MSRRYWGSKLAAGLIVVGVAAAFAVSHGVAVAQLEPCPNADAVNPYACYSQQELWDALLARPPSASDPEPYEPNCDSPKGRDEADLCAQRRMAKAAEELTALTRAQIIIGALTLLGLIATIFITLKATRAAENSVEVARDTAMRELRAYLAIAPEFMSSFHATNRAWCRYRIANVGATPANDVQNTARIEVFPNPLPVGFEFPALPPPEIGRQTTCFPHQPLSGRVTAARSFTAEEIAGIREGSARIYVYGETTYRDVFGGPGITKFGAFVDADSDTLDRLSRNYEGTDLKLDFINVGELNYSE